jgi:hypothetical protein
MGTNNFLPFSPTDTGTNLLSQGDYAVAPDRTIGNQPGVASSKLVNKALRQSAFISSQFAQYIADKTTANVLDDADTDKLLAQINAAILPLAPRVRVYTSGSGNHNLTYVYFIASGSATAGATYTNNSVTYTVVDTVASGKQIRMTGSGDPAAISGTLTKASGTGDATLTFFAYRKPILLWVKAVGAGGGGGPCGTGGTGTAGGAGGNTTFGAFTAGGGAGGQISSASTAPDGAAGGTVTGSPTISIKGQNGASPIIVTAAAANSNEPGGSGGLTPLAGGAQGGDTTTVAPAANTGAGGNGGSGVGSANLYPGPGGGAGAYFEHYYENPASQYAYGVGAAGTASVAGTNGRAGSVASAGFIFTMESYQ